MKLDSFAKNFDDFFSVALFKPFGEPLPTLSVTVRRLSFIAGIQWIPFDFNLVDAFGIDLALAASLGLAALVFVALLPLLVLLFTIGATQAPPPKMGRQAQ